jgi:hypothetical protein
MRQARINDFGCNADHKPMPLNQTASKVAGKYDINSALKFVIEAEILHGASVNSRAEQSHFPAPFHTSPFTVDAQQLDISQLVEADSSPGICQPDLT